jgi:putative transcriptional regulator
MHRSGCAVPLATLLLPLLAWMLALPSQAAEPAANAIFLVASPELRDPNFRETVVLVTQPPGGGPFGLVINRPLDLPLSEVFSDYESLKGRKEVLYAGGPVARDGLVFLVRGTKPPQGAMLFLPDVYLTADIEHIESLLGRNDPLQGLRVYAGYSGWAPGQLQDEIERGGWRVLPADAATIFEMEPSRIWPELEQRTAAKRTDVRQGGSAGGRTAIKAGRRDSRSPDLAL